MQVQLLFAVSSDGIDIDVGDGHAANDGNRAPMEAVLEQPRHFSAPESGRVQASADVDYWLGGYAGI